MFVQKLRAVVTGLVVVAVAVGGAFTYPAAGGTEPVPKTQKVADPFAPTPKTENTPNRFAPAPKGADPFAPPKSADPSSPAPKGAGPFGATPKGVDPTAPNGDPAPRFGPKAPADKPQPKQPFTPDTLNAKMLRELGNRFDVEVIGSTTGPCSGTELYFYDSNLDTAAVHAGLVKVGEKAVITVTVVKCPKSGEGSTRNGVKSERWDGARPTDTALVLQRLGKEANAARKDLEGLTPDDAVKNHLNERVPVTFVVGSVGYTWHTGFGAKEGRTVVFDPSTALKDGGKLRVFLSDKAVTHVANLGLLELGHGGKSYFEGKTIIVTGKIEALETPVKKGTDYRLVVSDLENLMVLK
jgi:hypothetical protein